MSDEEGTKPERDLHYHVNIPPQAPVAYRHSHEVVLQYVLANPQATLKETSEATGYTVAWLSILMRSRAFLQRRRELEDREFEEAILPLKDKMVSVAHKALDRLEERLDVGSISTPMAHNIARDLLAQIYPAAPKGPGAAVQINNVNLTPEQVMAMAREVVERKPIDIEPSKD